MQRNNYQESKKGQTQPERHMVFVNCIYNILGKKYMQPLTVASRMKLNGMTNDDWRLTIDELWMSLRSALFNK